MCSVFFPYFRSTVGPWPIGNHCLKGIEWTKGNYFGNNRLWSREFNIPLCWSNIAGGYFVERYLWRLYVVFEDMGKY